MLATIAAGCGKPRVKDGPAAAEPGAAVPAATEPPPLRAAYLAWRQSEDGREATSALFVDAGDGLEEVARRHDSVAIASGSGAWHLDLSHATLPVKPCDDDAEADFVDLAVRRLGTDVPAVQHVLADARRRPHAGDSAIHHERIEFRAQFGPYVLLSHVMNSDTCPVPAGGAIYEVSKVLDLRTGQMSEALGLLGEAERVSILAAGLPQAVAELVAAHPDASAAEIRQVLALVGFDASWSLGGEAIARFDIAGSHDAFESPAGDTSDGARVPGNQDDGRGFAEVDTASVITLTTWLAGE